VGMPQAELHTASQRSGCNEIGDIMPEVVVYETQ
jgi:hypothetical protein